MKVQSLDPYLQAIEEKHSITILNASNIGSQAWDLSSKESDYDIKLIFLNRPSKYSSISEKDSISGEGTELENYMYKKSSIEPSKIDYSGWDIRRFFELIIDNNPSAAEALCSPLQYRTTKEFIELENYFKNRFNPIEIYNHYRSMGKKNYKKYLQNNDEPTVKRNLYVIRSLMYSEYIKETLSFPDLNFCKFLQEYEDHDWDEDKIKNLIDLKKNGNNKDLENSPVCEEKIKSQLDNDIENYQKYVRDKHLENSDIKEIIETIFQKKTNIQ